jgi:coenzyme F420-0:L-glutamate ligase/coenzyme F420-1:gamma-L-glutamate ligase
MAERTATLCGVLCARLTHQTLLNQRSLAGQVAPNMYELATTVVAVADELAAAADLVLGKLERVPAAVIR